MTDQNDERRERYMEALRDADPYALARHPNEYPRLADAVMAVAGVEVVTALHAAADELDESEALRDHTDDHMGDVHATTAELRRLAGRIAPPGLTETERAMLHWALDVASEQAPMTDKPTVDNLDAEPEPARWCCDGNAEDCPLCTGVDLDYPWICPGHDDTEENRTLVAATKTVCTVTIAAQVPTEDEAASLARKISAFVSAEYGQEMRLTIQVGRPVKACCGNVIGHYPFCPARQKGEQR